MLILAGFVLNVAVFYLLSPSIFSGETFIFLLNHFREWKNQRHSEQEFPRLLESLAQAMRSGLNAEQAIKHVRSKGRWRGECKEVLCEIHARLLAGADMHLALVQVANGLQRGPERLRLKQALCSWASLVQSGGDAMQLLTSSADAARQAILVRRRAKSASAQMRLQATIIASAPCVVGLLLFFISPASLQVFWADKVGLLLLCVLVVMNVCGVFFLVKIARSWSG